MAITAAVRTRLAYAPQTWVYVVAAGAMAILLARHLIPDAAASHEHHMHGGHGAALSPVPTLVSTWLWWTVMSVAMMFPVAATGARRIAAAGLWRRRHIAMAEFLGGYLAAWALVGLIAVWGVAMVWPHGAPRYVVAAVLFAAAVWQVTPVRRRVLRRCRGPAFVNVRGWRADADAVAEGLADGRRCVVTCGPVMAVMAVGHSLVLMACLTALLLTERARGPNPQQRAGRPFEAWCLAALAGLVLVWGLPV
jgi:predicted metal-binding membrane protein